MEEGPREIDAVRYERARELTNTLIKEHKITLEDCLILCVHLEGYVGFSVGLLSFIKSAREKISLLDELARENDTTTLSMQLPLIEDGILHRSQHNSQGTEVS